MLITHAHIDHWGLATTLSDTVLAHPDVRPNLQFATDDAGPELAKAWPGAHWTPGHDPGHVCRLRPTDSVLICGDPLLPGYTPNIKPGFDGADARADFLHSLQRMAALLITLVLPAHGKPYQDTQTRAGEPAAHRARRLEQLQTAMRAGVQALRELSSRVFGADLQALADRMLARMEAYARLEHRHRRGLAWGDADGSWTAIEPPRSRG